MLSTGDSGPASLSRLFHRLTSKFDSEPSFKRRSRFTEIHSGTSKIPESPTESIDSHIKIGYTKWDLRVQELNEAYKAAEERKSLALPLHSQLVSETRKRRAHISRYIESDGSASEQELDSAWEGNDAAAKLCQEYQR